MEQMRNAHMLVVKPERNKSSGRPRRRWKDNIKVVLKETDCRLDFSGLGQDAVASSCENCNQLSSSKSGGKFHE
jgi:hypothetical protein